MPKMFNKKKEDNEKKLVNADIGLIDDLIELCKNLVSIESHAFGSYQSTKDEKYLDIMTITREIRTRYLSLIVKESKSQEWCLSKHLCESIMRLQEINTRFLSTGQKEDAKICIEDAESLHKMLLILNDYDKKEVKAISSA